jgi:D-3-phosphoglycerate dehydrogenase
MPQTLIFDFDSTFIQVETLDLLASIALQNHPEKAERLKMIEETTQQAMEGKIGFEESLETRFSLLSLNQHHIEQTIAVLKNKITPSILRNRSFFQKNKNNIYIVSGGFIDIVWPIVQSFGLHREHVFANRLLYDFDGQIHGYDKYCPLAQNQGKVKLLQRLNLPREIIVIGDGYNDYEMKEAGLADLFIAFTENIARPNILPLGDAVIDSLEGLFLTLQLPYQDQQTRKKVLLLEGIHSDCVQYFRGQGYDVTSLPNALADHELTEALKDINILGIRSKTTLTTNIIQACPHLEAVGAFCIGTNQIDLNQCDKQGISVFNAPYSNTRSVVELALAEIILLARQAAKSAKLLSQGQWFKSSAHAHEVRGKTLGIVGYGKIGSQLSILAEALGIRVMFYDLEDRLPLGNAKSCDTLDNLLGSADIVSIHVDGRESNRHLIDEAQFEKMKDGVIFLNLSRDFVVNDQALFKATQSGKVAGIGVDVFTNEPHASKASFTTPLQSVENAILTPHIGGSTEEAQQHIGEYVSRNLHLYCKEGATLGSVNFPALALPAKHYPQRILHLHDNVPGILAKINQLFAESNCNIEGQFLKTNEKMGYVITDLNHSVDENVVKQLKAIQHTIFVRKL